MSPIMNGHVEPTSTPMFRCTWLLAAGTHNAVVRDGRLNQVGALVAEAWFSYDR